MPCQLEHPGCLTKTVGDRLEQFLTSSLIFLPLSGIWHWVGSLMQLTHWLWEGERSAGSYTELTGISPWGGWWSWVNRTLASSSPQYSLLDEHEPSCSWWTPRNLTKDLWTFLSNHQWSLTGFSYSNVLPNFSRFKSISHISAGMASKQIIMLHFTANIKESLSSSCTYLSTDDKLNHG